MFRFVYAVQTALNMTGACYGLASFTHHTLL